MKLYIIRHADPDYEKGTITDYGHKEAAALAKRLDYQGVDAIYSSPMQRAIDTMKYTAKIVHKEPRIENWMQELSWMKKGSGEYKNPWDVPAELLLSQEPFPNHDNWHTFSAYAGNSIDNNFKRLKEDSDRFIGSLGYVRKGKVYECLQPNQDKVAVFCHAGFGLTWLAHLLQIPLTIAWSGFWLAPSSVTTIIFDQRSESVAMPRCIGLGDVSHLYESGLPTRPRGMHDNLKRELG
ncbi:histidine phosphatase family protein [Paenibacillus sp. FSL H7-0350]|uniref:histidine phosphatase family protein n=1 Tax=Paenibacillus sp. FSL H7-0350 TaxID=2975345 RepID=UPI003158FA67